VTTLSTVLKALSDPTRRAILERPRERHLTAGAIADGIASSKPGISHHVALLKQAGLVTAVQRG
jgi:DNA-binding transcriptional ArsR family regulator